MRLELHQHQPPTSRTGTTYSIEMYQCVRHASETIRQSYHGHTTPIAATADRPAGGRAGGGSPDIRESHVPTAESNHRPKLVNATMTANIQYCERTASSTLSYIASARS
jgi:hypothetical protein